MNNQIRAAEANAGLQTGHSFQPQPEPMNTGNGGQRGDGGDYGNWNAAPPGPSHYSIAEPDSGEGFDIAPSVNVSYWIQLDSANETISIPIDEDCVGGFEKDVAEFSLQTVWDWCEDKKLCDILSLKEMYDMAEVVNLDETASWKKNDQIQVNAPPANSQPSGQRLKTPLPARVLKSLALQIRKESEGFPDWLPARITDPEGREPVKPIETTLMEAQARAYDEMNAEAHATAAAFNELMRGNN